MAFNKIERKRKTLVGHRLRGREAQVGGGLGSWTIWVIVLHFWDRVSRATAAHLQPNPASM